MAEAPPRGGICLDAFLLLVPHDVVRAHAFAFAAVASLLSAFAGDALAANRWELWTSLDARDAWVRTMPEFTLRQPFTTPLRTLPEGHLPSTGSEQFLALAWDSGVTLNDRVTVPLFGVQFGWAVGQSSEVVTSLDGSIVHMHPWDSEVLSVLLPGIGVRAKRRRWAFSADVRGVASFAFTDATVATGTASPSISDAHALYSATLGARAELAVCRRIDPVERVCLFVSPALYEFSAFDGGSIGLRCEVGP
jgi:hypothetical protein